MTSIEHSEDDARYYADKAMTWYGWGSPIGLGLFVISLGVFLVLLHFAGVIR